MGNSVTIKAVVEKYNKGGKIVSLKTEEIRDIFKKYDENNNNLLEKREVLHFLNDVLAAVNVSAGDAYAQSLLSEEIYAEIDATSKGALAFEVRLINSINTQGPTTLPYCVFLYVKTDEK